MSFKLKDIIGFSALVLGLILSGVSLNTHQKIIQHPDETPNLVEVPVAKKIHKKRFPQSTKNIKEKSLKPRTLLKKPSLQNISKLIECYHKENCDYPNNDPREYKLSVGQDIKNSFKKASSRILSGEEKNHKYWHQAAIYSLRLPDGHIKEAALDVLSTQEPNSKTLEVLLSEVIAYHDPLLISQVLTELQKYNKPEYQKQIYTALSHALKTGSLLVKKEIVHNILPFLNKKSFPYFQRALKKLSPSSNIHTVLYKILKDYQIQQTGA